MVVVVVLVVVVVVVVLVRVGDKKGAKWSGLLWLLQRAPGRFTTKIYYKQYINLALEQVLSFTRAHNLSFTIKIYFYQYINVILEQVLLVRPGPTI